MSKLSNMSEINVLIKKIIDFFNPLVSKTFSVRLFTGEKMHQISPNLLATQC